MVKFIPEKGSEIMPKIRSKNAKKEVLVFQELKYWKMHYNKVSGSTDRPIRKKGAFFINWDF